MISVRVAITDGNASIGCGSCGLSLEYTVGPKKEPIDIYNEFVDKFMAGRIGATAA
jgi:transcription elongation factor Elf1